MKRLVIITTGDRPAMLTAALRSLHAAGIAREWRVSLVWQGGRDTPCLGAQHDVIMLPEAVGPHMARAAALDAWDAEIWCWWDDDMAAITGETLYGPAVARAIEPGVGLVSTGWRPSDSPGWARQRPRVDVWVRQSIVYTGGGLICSDEVAREIDRALPRGRLWCDNTEWSLACYLGGRQNWRWRGSVAIHRIGRRGGRRAWLATHPELSMPDPRWVRVRPSGRPGEHGCIPLDRDLTRAARQRHRVERRARGWA